MPYDSERCSLQGALQQGARIIWTTRANIRSKERRITKLIAERVLRRGYVDGVETSPNGQGNGVLSEAIMMVAELV